MKKTLDTKHNENSFHGNNSRWSKVQSYLSEFVYGGIDGSVTTFAVVAGSTGANLDPSVIIILGFANLFADGFSMSVGSYLSSKSAIDQYDKERRTEVWEIENMPAIEREEIKEIYRKKGLEGELLEKVVEVITSNKDRWVDVMMKEELNMVRETKPPLVSGVVTFVSFLIVGFIPLMTYVWEFVSGVKIENVFLATSILTGVAFLIIGYLKSIVAKTGKIKGIAETILLGGVAAVVAYFVGSILEKMFR